MAALRDIAIRAIAAIVIVCGFAASAQAFSIEFQGRGVKRTLLALYDGSHETTASGTRLHKLAEMPLNHLGYILEFHDVRKPLPDAGLVARRYRGVITWFVEALPDAGEYLTWLDQVTSDGGKLVALGEVAPRETTELVPRLNRVLARIGIQSAASFQDMTFKARIAASDDAVMGFERKVDKVIPSFPVIGVRSAATRSHLRIEIDTPAGRIETHPVTSSDAGGYVAQNFLVELDPNTNRLGWIINPFTYFRLALGDERFPIPDVTTLSGRRIYLSHIDGDGWNNQSEVEGYRETQALSVEVVTKEAVEAYPDLPVSIGLIAGDAQPLLGGSPEAAKWAKRLYALPQVEVASHTHTHPYDWSFFETYDRREEEAKIGAYRPPAMPLRERLTAAMMRAAGKAYVNPLYDPYIAGTNDLPRTYLREPYSLAREVAGALRFSELLAPPGKKAKLYLWSGDTTPFEAAVAATRAVGARNMNGGDSRLDKEYPSVAYVPPLSRIIGRERQIYAVNSNENTYTNDWTGPFGGQMMLRHTLDNTDTPRRLKGFNLYYHMYSGEKPASLRAIRHFLDLARRSPVIPIAASDYAAMADDYFGIEMEQVDLFSWAITRRGAVETVRFDDADKLAVDVAASAGVLGSRRHEGALYVALDPVVSRSVVSLMARPPSDVPAAQPRKDQPMLSLIEARWRLADQRSGECMQTYRATGYGVGEFVWQTVRNRAFKVRLSRGGATLSEEVRFSDADGRLAIVAAVDGLTPVDLVVTCHD